MKKTAFGLLKNLLSIFGLATTLVSVIYLNGVPASLDATGLISVLFGISTFLCLLYYAFFPSIYSAFYRIDMKIRRKLGKFGYMAYVYVTAFVLKKLIVFIDPTTAPVVLTLTILNLLLRAFMMLRKPGKVLEKFKRLLKWLMG